MSDPHYLLLRCACGALRGRFDATGGVGNRHLCYCDDCQAYARWLGRDDVMNARGGTDIIQTWPARVRLDVAGPPLARMKLSEKGLNRWYAACCRTPVANTMSSARLPFTGLMRQVVDADDAQINAIFGATHGIQGRYAIGGCPPDADASASFGVIARSVSTLARGAWSGAHQPSPFFGADGQPSLPALVLDPEARRALYPNKASPTA